MQKSKIEWCDMTWNPVTGCLHGCPYCYAARQVWRFSDHKEAMHPTQEGSAHFLGTPWETAGADLGKVPYPYGFEPTFHRYRLDEPARRKKPAIIFAVSMGDLFGEWVPDSWIKQVFDACLRVPQHIYIFLTKNPARYMDLANAGILPNKENFWFGSSVPTQDTNFWRASAGEYHSFVSIEPILEPFEHGNIPNGIQWVIVGAQTGPGAKEYQPKPEWVDTIVNQCRIAEVPVFLKNSLAGIVRKPLLQEYPGSILKHMGR